jgi:hypothetical protein
MLSKMLIVLSFGLAASIAIFHASPVDALRQRYPPAHRHLSVKGPIDTHAYHPRRHPRFHHHRNKAHHERKQVGHDKSKSMGVRHLGAGVYDDYNGYDDSSDDYGRGYGCRYGNDDSFDYGDSYDDSSDYGNSYDDSSDYGYGLSHFGYGPSPYGYGGGGFGRYYPPFVNGGLERAVSPVGSDATSTDVARESAVSSSGGGAAPTPMTTTATTKIKKAAEAKKMEKKMNGKSAGGAK